MPNNAIPYGDQFAHDAATLGGKLSGTADELKDRVSDFGRTAANSVDSSRDAAGSGLLRAATALHEKAAALPGGERVSGMARATAEKLSSTADYVRDNSGLAAVALPSAWVNFLVWMG